MPPSKCVCPRAIPTASKSTRYSNRSSRPGGDFNFTAHALIKENGKTFYWSFKNMDFFEGHERLDRNFPCRPSKGWTTAAASNPPHRPD